MPLTGDHVPSPVGWVADEVEHYLRTGRAWGERPVVVLTTVGARSRLLRRTPVMRVEHRGSYAVVASAAGAAEHPAWHHNLMGQPRVDVLDGVVLHERTARELTGAERSAWWSRACGVFPSYADYASRTARVVPVWLLEP